MAVAVRAPAAAAVPPPSRFHGRATVVAVERTQKEKVVEEKPGAIRLSLSAAFLCAGGGRSIAYRVCALPPPPLGGESDKDRRPDDKSFMVLRPHVDGGRRRT
jgi:hypothetical protein